MSELETAGCKIVLHQAIDEADRLRREHNGICGVILFLGHDGNSTCEFRDIDGKQIAKADSGVSLFMAIEKCKNERRKGNLANKWQSIIVEAVQRFNSQSGSGGIFNTANFQNAAKEHGCDLSSDEAEHMLLADVGIVRLSGGAHWMPLPMGVHRYAETTK